MFFFADAIFGTGRSLRRVKRLAYDTHAAGAASNDISFWLVKSTGDRASVDSIARSFEKQVARYTDQYVRTRERSGSAFLHEIVG